MILVAHLMLAGCNFGFALIVLIVVKVLWGIDQNVAFVTLITRSTISAVLGTAVFYLMVACCYRIGRP